MKIDEIRKKAKQIGITNLKQNKIDLVRNIQAVEGNCSCFSTEISSTCDQKECCWIPPNFPPNFLLTLPLPLDVTELIC